MKVKLLGERVANLAAGLSRVEEMRHVVVYNPTNNLDCLSHIERLDVYECSLSIQEILVLLLSSSHACICTVFADQACGMQQLLGLSVLHVRAQESTLRQHNLHSLHIAGWRDLGSWMSFDLVAQCPALRVLELYGNISLESAGTTDQAV